MRRVAVIGAGVAGLAAARQLAGHARVTLFEAGDHFGGHAHTVELQLGGITHGVDCGFLVYNERTYPGLTALFAELGVETAPSEMSLSVQLRGLGVEWSGSDVRSLFAQPANLARPGFWRMLADIVRFNRLATALVERPAPGDGGGSIGEFLDEHRFSRPFRDWYFLPMIGCIWSCPTRQMLAFPAWPLARFCREHGLLQVSDRPPWRTVRGGSRHYVDKMLATIEDTRLRTPVRAVRRRPEGVDVATADGSERFDACVLACHSDQALALLSDASAGERAVLGAIGYHANRALLHTDARVLPRRRRAWAAWNYDRGGSADSSSPVCLHYLLNRLQPLPFDTPVIVSLNPAREPDPATVHGEFHFAHPVFDRAALAAQQRLPTLQGVADTWFCGAWTGYGFHEDGLASGLAAAAGILARFAQPDRATTIIEPRPLVA